MQVSPVTLGHSHIVPVHPHPLKAKAGVCVTALPHPAAIGTPSVTPSSQARCLPVVSSPALASLYLGRAQKQHHCRLGGCNQCTLLSVRSTTNARLTLPLPLCKTPYVTLGFHFSKAARAALCVLLFDQVSFLSPSSPVSLFV